jgi:hypothetical protein
MGHPAADDLLREQDGVATRYQLTALGMTQWQIDAQVEGKRWRLLNEHVVICHNGPVTLRQRLWAVDLSAPGLHAMAGLTAMQLWGVNGFETDTIHVLVPRGGHVLPVADITVAVHESRRFVPADVVHGRAPQLVRLARATVDAAAWSDDVWTASRILVAPVQQRRLRAAQLRDEVLAASRMRHRRRLLALANDLCGGAEALSEVEFLRFCRRHGLPRPLCQRRMDSNGKWRYLDATFVRPDRSLLRVEIDGGVHLSLAVRSRDTLKDNEANLARRLVLRFASAAIYADDPQALDQIRRGLSLRQRLVGP